MEQLGRLEDLPHDFIARMNEIKIKPLWPSLKSLLPLRNDIKKEAAFHWHYNAIRPLLFLSGELTPISKAERRVLVLKHPDSADDSLRATPSIYAGIQLILPGERAPSHRHNASAARIAIETEKTYTTVDGKSYLMERGDLILTPYGMWHEHNHDGKEPATWLDILDLPVITMLGISYSENSLTSLEDKENDNNEKYRNFCATQYSVVKFSWVETKQKLELKAADIPLGELAILEYVDPDTQQSCLKTLGFFAAVLRKGEVCHLAKNSSTGIVHIIEGELEIEVDGINNRCFPGDVISLPTFSAVTLRNNQKIQSYIIFANDKPLQSCLGLFEIIDK